MVCCFVKAESSFSVCKYLSNAPLGELSASECREILRPTFNCQKLADQISIAQEILRVLVRTQSHADQGVVPPLRPLPVKIFTPCILREGRQFTLGRHSTMPKAKSLRVRSCHTAIPYPHVVYASGAVLGEALDLRVEDIHFKYRRMTLPGDRMIQSRSIPVCRDLQQQLRVYVT